MWIEELPYMMPGEGFIIDVGMHKGEFAETAIDHFRPNHFLGIEMLPNLVRQLRLNPKFYHPPQYDVIECALGDTRERSAFYRVPKWEASSSLLRINPEASEWYGRDLQQSSTGEQVTISTLDWLLFNSMQAGRPIDLFKIDVQGYEARVLRGASEALLHTQAVVIEVLFCQHYYGQSSEHSINTLLNAAGLHFSRWLWRCDQEGDALYERK